MMREIKFRAWDGKWLLNRTLHDRNWYAKDDRCVKGAMPHDVNILKIMQYTGLKDKNGKELCESDLVNVFFTSSEGEHIHDCIYKVSISPLYGITLTFVKLLWESYGFNQFTSSTRLTSEYKTLGEDYQNQNYDRLAVRDTWGENHMFKNTWKENDYSNYIEIIGNIYENPELLTTHRD